ncbi:MAG TPA: NAD(P)H-dependent oxidoreductase subunit E [Myxococcales bacterium]
MDLRQMEAEPTADERDAIDALLGAAPEGQEADGHFAAGIRRSRRHLLLPALQAAQARAGWISEGALGYVCRRLVVPPADAWGVATFYGLLSTEPRPARVLHVCEDIACRCSGAAEVIAALERTLGDGDGAPWRRSPCLGLCDQAPAAFLTVAGRSPAQRLFGPVTAEEALAALAPDGRLPDMRRRRLPQAGDPSLRLLRRVGSVDPESLDDYLAHGGYRALERAFAIGPEAVIREVLESKIMGRGGAAFPMGRKWDAVARQPARPHYLVCNADESEPGTFKDRVLLEGDPFAVLESMTICACATGCEEGFVYLRGEYPLAAERLQSAIDAARARGLLGNDVMGKGVRFDVEIRRGAGAYICGEETAIFNSIEGYRGEPRNKPPFPVEAGLFGRPTVVNNVETLVNVLGVLLEGGQAYAGIGTAQSTGPKLFSVCGCVERPGVYEVRFGATLRDLIDLAGGVRAGRKAQAILLGGAAGAFVRGDEVDIPLTFEGARAARVTLGSGAVMVFDDSIDLIPVLLRIAAFFREESCGQCVPCRVGTVRQEEALRRLAAGQPRGGAGAELLLLDEIGRAMKDASICGLGQTAYGAVESAATRLRIFAGGEGA